MIRKKNIAVVSSKGGHLGQIKLLFTKEVIGENNFILITEDNQPKIEKKFFLNKYKTYFFKKDSLNLNPFSYLFAIVKLIKIFRKEKINVLFTNGAQLSIPAVIVAKILNIKSIFIDTMIRVVNPNWSARASYPFVDTFLVQHKNMAFKYGKKAKYHGGII